MAKKTVKLLGSAGALVLATGLSNQVMAAEQTDTQPLPETSVQAQSISEVSKSDVSKAELDEVKAELDKVDTEISDQNQKLSQLKTEMTEATQIAETATTQLKAAEEASQEDIDTQLTAAQAVVDNAEKALLTANQEVEAAQDALPSAQTAVTDQEKAVASHQGNLELAKADVDVAQQLVKDAQAVLDGTGQTQLTQTIQAAKADIARLSTEATNVKTELDKSKEADANRDTILANARTTVAQAETKVSEQESRLDAATVAANRTAVALANAQNNQLGIEASISKSDRITIPAAYIPNLRTYMANNSTTAFNNLVALVDSGKAQNVYKEKLDEERITFPTNDIPLDIRTELSLYASDLVNQVRQYFGTVPTTVTRSSVDFAKGVADNYVADDWSFQQTVQTGHNVNGIIRATRPYNLVEGQHYENMYTISISEPTMSLNAAKRLIHAAVLGYIFNEHEYEHAKSITGLLWDKQTDATYLGIDFSSRSTAHSVHFLTVETPLMKSGSTFDKTSIANQTSLANLSNNLQNAQTSVNQAQADNQQAQASLTDEQNKLDRAKQELTKAQEDLKKAQDPNSNTLDLEVQYQQIQAQLAAAQQKVTDAEAALANINASSADKQEALAKAQQDLETKMASLVQAQTDLKQAQDRLAQLETELNQAKDRITSAETKKQAAETVLDSAKARVDALKTRTEDNQKAVLEARLALTNALAALKEKTEASLQANDRLADLIKLRDSLSERYNQLLSQYRASQQTQQTNQVINQALDQLNQGNQGTGTVTDKEDDKSQFAQLQNLVHKPGEQQARTTVPTSHTGGNGSKTLPQTGTRESQLALLGLMATSLGLVLASRKKEKE